MKETFEAAIHQKVQQPKVPAISPEEIKQRRRRLREELGFSEVEIDFVKKHKPTLFQYEEDGNIGIPAMEKLFIGKLGYDAELLRTLIVKFPELLSKKVDHIEKAFELLEKEGFDQQAAMKLIFDCPRLLSKELDK